MSLYLGVDIAKETHFAAMTNQLGEILLEPFPFPNNASGFAFFLDQVLPFISRNDDLLVGFESTAHYAANFIQFLETHHFHYSVINPLVTSSMRKSNIRKTKTDSLDSLLICSVLSQLSFKKSLYRSSEYEELYELCRAKHNLIKMRTKAKIQLVSYMDRIFPELASFFKGNLQINTAYTLIKQFPLPMQIKKVRLDQLAQLLTKASHGHYKKEKAMELKELAFSSVGVPSASYALQAQLAIDQIELYTQQIASLDSKINETVDGLQSVLKSIPGLDSSSIAVILSVTHNFINFDSASKVIAFAGLDPVVNQSGKWKARHTRMSKRGNSLLRYTLVWASWNVCRHNTTFMNYYLKKIKAGKSHYCALGHCAGKLTRIIFKLVKSNSQFNLE